MSAEFYIYTNPRCWIKDNLSIIENIFIKHQYFIKESDTIFIISENTDIQRYMPSVVFRFDNADCIIMEINSHSEEIEDVLLCIIKEIKQYVNVVITDEDGEVSDWGANKYSYTEPD